MTPTFSLNQQPKGATLNTVTIVQTDIGIDDVEEDLVNAGPYRYYFIPFGAMSEIAEHKDGMDLVRVLTRPLPMDRAAKKQLSEFGLLLDTQI